MSTQNPDAPVKPQRRHDIDWLRVMAVLLLFPFHTARIFDIWEEFYVKNAVVSNPLTVIIAYLGPWHMPLFFLLAGASTWFALRFRTGGQYARERVKRLLLPFVFGVLVLVPLQPYLGLLNHGNGNESFLRWYPQFFRIIPEDMDGYFLGGHTWGQLWFIFHLIIYSLVALPLFLYLNRPAGQRLISRLAGVCTHRGVILLFAIPLLLTLGFPDIAGGNPLFYILFFICGYILMADARFGKAIDRHKGVALVLGPVVLIAVAYFAVWGLPKGTPDWVADTVSDYGEAFISWFSLIALLGYGKKALSFTNRLLMYAAEGAYPLYLIHQTAIVAVGFWVVQWQASPFVKFLVILAASLTVTVLVYDVIVKRSNLVRFLFGMAPKKPRRVVPAARPKARVA
jgi:glucans biosynthesis protein C